MFVNAISSAYEGGASIGVAGIVWIGYEGGGGCCCADWSVGGGLVVERSGLTMRKVI